MVSRRISVNFAAALGAALLLAACANPIDTHGNLPDSDKMAQIKPGQTDKATVTRLLGSPSSTAAFDDNTWYYISQKDKPLIVSYPQVIDQEVFAITFDDKGMVRNVSHLTMADAEPITPNPNATPAPGREFTVLEQLIGNFGRFSGSNDKKNPGGSSPGGGP